MAVKNYLADTSGSEEMALFLHTVPGKVPNRRRLRHHLAKSLDGLFPGAMGRTHDTRKFSTSGAFCLGFSVEKMSRQALGGLPAPLLRSI